MDDIVRLPLATLPTPVMELRGWDRPVGVYVKRDDLTGLELSGNKVRKLEFSLAAALAGGARRVVTAGGVQSNHCRATAAAAARLGLEAHLVLEGPEPETARGNLLLARLLGARITWLSPCDWCRLEEVMAELAGPEGRVIPVGASDATGSLGYREAAAEIGAWEEEHGIRFTAIIHAHGSGGTAAGLLWGLEAQGSTARLLSVDVCGGGPCGAQPPRQLVENILRQGEERYGLPRPDLDRWQLLEGYAGPGYGLTTPDRVAFLGELARRTGLVLDPVYTGKAFAALVDLADRQELEPGPVLFLHTGGLFGLFGSRVAELL